MTTQKNFTNAVVISKKEENTMNEEIIIRETMKLFKSHLNDDKLIEEVKEREGNAYVQKVTLLPDWNGTTPTVVAKLSTTAVQITPVNEGYMQDNCILQSVLGNKVAYKKGSKKLVILDVSAISSIDKVRSMAAAIVKDSFFLAEIDGKVRVLLNVADPDSGDYLFQDISGKKDENGDLPIYDASHVFTKTGRFKAKAHRFAGEEGCAINSSSQGRKKQLACYENSTKTDINMYLGALKKANLDEYSLAVKTIGLTDPKGAADINTRVSAKTTAMGLSKSQGCRIGTYAIIFGKDDNTDGRFAFTCVCIAKNLLIKRGIEFTDELVKKLAKELCGYLIQSRPYSVKGAGLSMSQEAFDMELANYNLLRIDATDKKNKKLLEGVQVQLSKQRRGSEQMIPELKGYDGVIICHDGIDAPVEMYGDLNAFKDQYDLTQTDGVNVLAVAHMPAFDFMRAGTSAQLLKIVLRAVKMAPELKEDFQQTMCAIIKRQIDADMDFSAKARLFGAEKIDTSYVPQVARDLNPNNIAAYPSVYRGIIDDAQRRVENTIMSDKYQTAGHFGMFTSDPVYHAWGKSVLNVVTKTVSGVKITYAEVYDPVFNRYARINGIADNRGVAIKHPAMGTMEILFVTYISDKEMFDRIHKLGEELGKSEHEMQVACGTINTLKEGAVILPADLEMIAWIAAGSDLDGDKAGFHFIDKDGLDIVHTLWNAMLAGKFSSRAVNIGNDGRTKEMDIKVGTKMFQTVMALMINTGNKDVGIVTNAFRILAEGLLLDENDTDGKGFFMSIFDEVFDCGTEGNGAYVSPIAREEVRGVFVNKTPYNVMELVEKAIREMAFTWENVLAALDDLDVVGRHIQELTIDAQKKFYEVVCSFIDKLNQSFSLSPFEAAIQFDMNWSDKTENGRVLLKASEGYFVNEKGCIDFNRIFAVIKGKGMNEHAVTVLADAFARFRVYAANYAVVQLNKARKSYLAAVDDESMKEKRQMAYDRMVRRTSQKALVRLHHVVKMAMTANHIYGDLIKALRDEYINPNMNIKEIREIDEDIRKEARAKLGDMLANISNEIRVVAAAEKLNVIDTIIYVAENSDVVGGLAGKLLKEEVCYYLAKKSEIHEVRRELFVNGIEVAEVLNSVCETADGRNVVAVRNGAIVNTDVRVNLMDGEYTLEESDGKLELVRPLTDFVELPNADFSKVTVSLDAKYIDRIEEVDDNVELHLAMTKKDKKGVMVDAMGLFNADGEMIAEVFCGGFKRGVKAENQEFNINAAYYNGIVGNLEALDITAKDINGNRYFLVTLSGIHREKFEEAVTNVVVPQVDTKKALSAEEILDF